MSFFGGVFWHEQLIKFFLASTCDFSSLPPSLLLSALISTKPSQRCIRVPGHHSRRSRFPILFLFLFQGRVLFTSRVYYLPIRIPPFSETRKREREREQEEETKKERKKKNELPRVCRIRTKTYIYTCLLPTYLIVSSNPPVRIQKSIVYLPTYLLGKLTSLAPVNFRKSYVYLKATYL